MCLRWQGIVKPFEIGENISKIVDYDGLQVIPKVANVDGFVSNTYIVGEDGLWTRGDF